MTLGVLCISAATLELLAFSQTIDNVLTPKALEGRYSASIGEPRGSSGRCVDLLALQGSAGPTDIGSAVTSQDIVPHIPSTSCRMLFRINIRRLPRKFPSNLSLSS